MLTDARLGDVGLRATRMRTDDIATLLRFLFPIFLEILGNIGIYWDAVEESEVFLGFAVVVAAADVIVVVSLAIARIRRRRWGVVPREGQLRHIQGIFGFSHGATLLTLLHDVK